MSTETRIEAGPELDALVAVEVMGWSVWRVDEREEQWVRGGPGSSYESSYASPAYSTSGVCLEVLERLSVEGYDVSISRPGIDWAVNIGVASVELPTTLPHAICLAALEAVRAEKEGE